MTRRAQRAARWRKAGFAVPLILLAMLVMLAPALRWVREHPQHNPWAPLAIADPPGSATHRKVSALSGDPAACHMVLRDAGVRFSRLPPIGSGQCLAEARTRFERSPALPFRLLPANVAPSCPVATGLLIWMRHVVQPAAERHFGQRVTLVENLGSYNCRPIRGGSRISEHASGNAIDISAFVLADGRRVSLARDWDGEATRAAFLREVRDGGCDMFSTVLSPDYNAAHADHFHFDMAQRVAGWRMCR